MYMKTTFDGSIDIPRLLRTIQHPEERVKWDRDVEQLKIVSLEDDYMPILYQRSPSMVSFVSGRDFLEKKILIRVSPKEYIVYFSSVPDEVLPEYNNNQYVRAYGITGF